MSCGCNNENIEDSKSDTVTLKVEFLFLDETVCAPCGGTSDALAQAVSLVKPAIDALNLNLEVVKIHVADQSIAIAEKFQSSPTIRVNGIDIDPAITEDDCPTCGSLAQNETSVSCRTWHWNGEVFQAAPVGKIVEEIMAAALSFDKNESRHESHTASEDFELPENLIGFFAARAKNQQLGC